MAIDTSGTWWVGSSPEDIDEYLRAYTSDCYPVHELRLAKCSCGSVEFFLLADDNEGAAQRKCASCSETAFVCDSEEYWDEAEPEAWRCVECKGETANVGIGFSLYEGTRDVRWLYVGVRCVRCGVLGCFAGWKIGYEDSTLLDRA